MRATDESRDVFEISNLFCARRCVASNGGCRRGLSASALPYFVLSFPLSLALFLFLSFACSPSIYSYVRRCLPEQNQNDKYEKNISNMPERAIRFIVIAAASTQCGGFGLFFFPRSPADDGFVLLLLLFFSCRILSDCIEPAGHANEN